MQTNKKILIVEDEPAIAADLSDILEMSNYKVCGIAYSYDQAIEKLAAFSPDLVLLDIALKGSGSGLDVATVLNKKYNIPFIFITSFADQDTIQEVVKLNPSGYLVKPFKEKDIAPLVELTFAQVRKNTTRVFPDMCLINQNINRAISPQEYKVLSLIWSGNKNKEIAEKLFVSINTVKTHVIKLYHKLEVQSRAEAIHKVINL